LASEIWRRPYLLPRELGERADVRHILLALAALAASVFVLANAVHGL
jgi:hypothetical protein